MFASIVLTSLASVVTSRSLALTRALVVILSSIVSISCIELALEAVTKDWSATYIPRFLSKYGLTLYNPRGIFPPIPPM